MWTSSENMLAVAPPLLPFGPPTYFYPTLACFYPAVSTPPGELMQATCLPQTCHQPPCHKNETTNIQKCWPEMVCFPGLGLRLLTNRDGDALCPGFSLQDCQRHITSLCPIITCNIPFSFLTKSYHMISWYTPANWASSLRSICSWEPMTIGQRQSSYA